MSYIGPLVCCVKHAIATGKTPALSVRCPSCADYRSYLEHVRYAPSGGKQ